MLYFLFEYLENQYQLAGASLFQYISFRSSLAFIFSLFISIKFGKRIILFLKNKQIGETVRDLGLDGQKEKNGTPTMGGLLIIFSTIFPVLLFSNFLNIYIQILLFTTIWLGLIGFLDDYIKIFKKNKKGLKGKFKIIGQVVLGLVVGLTIYLHPDVTLKNQNLSNQKSSEIVVENIEYKSTKTTVPFLKDNEFDYSFFSTINGEQNRSINIIVFIFFSFFFRISNFSLFVTTIFLTLKLLICFEIKSIFLSVDNNITLKFFLSSLITSNVCLPIDPVDPNIIIFFILIL